MTHQLDPDFWFVCIFSMCGRIYAGARWLTIECLVLLKNLPAMSGGIWSKTQVLQLKSPSQIPMFLSWILIFGGFNSNLAAKHPSKNIKVPSMIRAYVPVSHGFPTVFLSWHRHNWDFPPFRLPPRDKASRFGRVLRGHAAAILKGLATNLQCLNVGNSERIKREAWGHGECGEFWMVFH